MIDLNFKLEKLADQAAGNVLITDDTPYFKGMEQAFRESKLLIIKEINYYQEEIQEQRKKK